MIDEDRAVAVAVERDAQLASAARRPVASQQLGVRRSAFEVDVAAVRLVAR